MNEPINHFNFCIRPRPSLTCSYTVLSPWNGFLCFGNCHRLHNMMSKFNISSILQYRLFSFSGSSVIQKQTNWCPDSKIKPNSQDFCHLQTVLCVCVCVRARHPPCWHMLIALYQKQLRFNYMSLF
jgi:hypothetical protein